MNIRKNKNLGKTIIFYCKDCEKIVQAAKEPRRFVYMCGICGTKNVAFGTEKSIRNFYHVIDDSPVIEEHSDTPSQSNSQSKTNDLPIKVATLDVKL
ncbi:hypothetical protein HYV57_04205 [Candidatus Peregrinibacteria bacterium]|nr:hypothetical protein [Candidatus Peregrinibacteria bacterium]